MAPTIQIPTGDGQVQEIAVGSALPETLPLLPLKDSVPFPDTLMPLAVGQEHSIQLVNDALAGNRTVAMVASRDGNIESPDPESLYSIGVAGVVARMLKVPDGSLRILVHGSQRVEIGEVVRREPYLVARVTPAPDVVEPSSELEALFRNVQGTFTQIVEQVP